MRIADLIDELEWFKDMYGDDIEVVFKAKNSMYTDDVSEISDGYGVRAFYGDDYKVILLTGSQCGAVCSEYDLTLDDEDQEDCDIE